ncbi:MAG: PLAT/LH2 domain-containing protein [Saprospiraceae bacterium]
MKVNSIQFQLVSALTFTIAFSITNLFSQKPNFVRPASVNDLKIQYISFTVQTANLEDAGTDDYVYIQLNDNMKPFYLNKSGDDFERNKLDFYIFADPAIKTVRDIKYLKIGKSGSDGWALKKISLDINGATFYSTTFSNLWLDNTPGKSLTKLIPGTALNGSFSLAYSRLPNIHKVEAIMPFPRIKTIVETIVGSGLIKITPQAVVTCAAWGNTTGINTLFGEAVELAYEAPDKLKVDLDLQYKLNNAPNPEYDVDIVLQNVLNTAPGNIIITPESSWGAYGNCLDKEQIISRLQAAFSRVFNIGVKTHFDSSGNLIYY